jgi:hypothetical protein
MVNTDDPIYQLETLRRQYYSIYPIHKLRLPHAQLLLENQSYLLAHILDDPQLSQYGPEAGYQKPFWRKVVSGLEQALKHTTEAEPDTVYPNPRNPGVS